MISPRFSPRSARCTRRAARRSAEPRLERVAVVGFCRQVHFRRRNAQLVELLNRRLEHFTLGHAENRCFGAELDALDDAPAAHLEHLHDEAGGPELQPEHVAVTELGRAIFCWRSWRVWTVRIASRSCAACS